MSFDQYNALAQRIVTRFETLTFDGGGELIDEIAHMVRDYMNQLVTSTIKTTCDDQHGEAYTSAVAQGLAWRDEFSQTVAGLLVCMEQLGIMESKQVSVIEEAICNGLDALETLLCHESDAGTPEALY